MQNKPYIPVYTGDFLKKVNGMPVEVVGGCILLTIRLWNSKEVGIITDSLQGYRRCMQCDTVEQAVKILESLAGSGYFELKQDGAGYTLIDFEMHKKADISIKRSKSGKDGVEAKKNKKGFAQANALANVETNALAVAVANCDNDNDNDIDTENSKVRSGGVGEEEGKQKGQNFTSWHELASELEFLKSWKLDEIFKETRFQFLTAHSRKYGEVDDEDWMNGWVKVFVDGELQGGVGERKSLGEWKRHFANWFRINYRIDINPKNIKNGNIKAAAAGAKGGIGNTGSNIITAGAGFWD